MTFLRRFFRRKLLLISILLLALIVVLYVNHKRFATDLSVKTSLTSRSDGLLSNADLLSLSSSRVTTIEANVIDIEGLYDKKLIQLSEVNKCDLCLGRDFCRTFVTNVLVQSISSPIDPKYVSYRRAVIKNTNQKITLMSESSDKWSNLEAIICLNASQRVSTCDQSLAVRNSFVSKSDLFLIENYRHLFRQILSKDQTSDGQQSEHFLQALFSQCATKNYLQFLQNSFDSNYDKHVDLSEQSYLLSALLASPGYAVHRMLRKTESDLQVLKLKGVCGRLVAFDGRFQPLADFIRDEPTFEAMAGVAVQMIQLVDDLQEEDPNWYYLHTELTIDSFVVNSEGELFLSDLNHLLVIDRSLLADQSLRSHQSLLHSEVCNEPCLHTFHNRFVKAFNTTSSLPSLECQRIHLYYGQHMYAMICRNIFSAHELVDDQKRNNSESKIAVVTTRPSLLMSVPNKDRENVDDLLRECLYETSPGGRKQAVDELRDLLKSYLRFDDSVDQNNVNNNNNNNLDNNINEDDEDSEDNDLNNRPNDDNLKDNN